MDCRYVWAVGVLRFQAAQSAAVRQPEKPKRATMLPFFHAPRYDQPTPANRPRMANRRCPFARCFPCRQHFRQRPPARHRARIRIGGARGAAAVGCGFCRALGRRTKHYGSGKQGRARGQKRSGGAEHCVAARAAPQSVSGFVAAISIFCLAQIGVCALFASVCRVCGRLGHAG